MANEKKQDKELSVEERLKTLYQLQTLLSEIDHIKILRGELPHEVKDREDEIVRFQTRIQKHKDEIENLKSFISQKTADIEERRAKIAKYEEQINNVRNNREFAFLEKEKEYESLEIELAEKNIREAKAKMETKSLEIEHDSQELADNENILVQKKKELEEIVNETRQDEENIRQQVKELEENFDDTYTLNAFKRIRKNARNGLGIVTVQRNACGGCFNRIPPQRQLEIKMHKKVIVCEYCGRIMIDSVLAGVEENNPEPTPQKRGRAKSQS